jgi:subtilisin family serine protease
MRSIFNVKEVSMGRALIFIPILALILSNSIGAAQIDVSLQETMSKMQPGESVKALVYLSEQADIAALDQTIRNEHASLGERNHRVIAALQDIASRTQPEIAAYLDNLKARGQIKSYRLYWIANMFKVETSRAGIAAIAARQDIDKIYLDYEIEDIEPLKIEPSDNRLVTSHEIGLDKINATAAWAAGFTGQGRIVMNIDTGVLGTHPALSARFRGDVDQDGDVDESWFDPYDTHYLTPNDTEGHGTHTMGTICGRTPDGDTIGVAIDARWIAAGAIDRGGGIARTVADAIASFQWAADPDENPNTQDNPDAIGNSWGVTTNHGYPPCDETFWSVIDNCEAAGSVVIFSAGNEGPSPSSLRRPADRGTTAVNCFSVGAVNGGSDDLPIASFSSRGPSNCGPNGEEVIKPEVVAPGVNIRSSYLNNSYATMSGTSMASPHVTGAIALIRQANPDLDAQTIKEILIATAHGLPEGDPDGEDNYYGYGIIDIYEACMAAQSLSGIDGFVRDNAMNPIQGAKIEISGSSKTKLSAMDGSYSFALSGDTSYSLVASKFAFITADTTVYVSRHDTAHVDFTLLSAPRGNLQGHITAFADSSPIEGAVVSIANTPLIPTVSGGDGSYYFQDVPGGATYLIKVMASGFALGEDTVFITANQTANLDFSLHALQSFEIDNGGWVGSGDWQWGVPVTSPDAAYDGDKVWGTILNGDYSSNANDTLMTRYYIVDQPQASLSFYHWYDIESRWDGANVSVSRDGGLSWIVIEPEDGYPADSIRGLGFTSGYTGMSNGWELAIFELGQFQNQAIKFNFRLGSDGSLQRPGWSIDGVSITGATLYDSGVPDIEVTPLTFNVSLSQGDSVSYPITISNSGNGILVYGLQALTYGNSVAAVSPGSKDIQSDAIPESYTRVEKDVNGRTSVIYTGPKADTLDINQEQPPAILDYGGPDGFGYMWFDSNEPNGPIYNWVDISGIGQSLDFGFDDQNLGPFDLGFEMPFYDMLYNSIRICSNGWISFTSSGTNYNNSMLPVTAEPNNLIAPFWDDINPTLGGNYYFYTNSTDSAIVAWVDAPRYGRTGLFTFEIILTADGDITYQYLSMTGTINSATIGIENSTGTIGSMVSFNEAYVTESLAVQHRIPLRWLSVNPLSGFNLPGTNSQPSAKFTTIGINEGRYYGHINIFSNDPDEQSIILPCTLQVRPAEISEPGEILPQEFRLSQNYPNPFNPSTQIAFAIPRKTDISIVIYDILGREIRKLIDGPMDAGEHTVIWDGRDKTGSLASSGIYFYTLKAADFINTRRMSLIK